MKWVRVLTQTGVFEHFIRNPTCCHIVFGACHDNGYVRTLEDYASDSTAVQKMTLLYSFNIGVEFKKLPFRSTRMKKLFRTTPPEIPPKATHAMTYKRTWVTNVDCFPPPKRLCSPPGGSTTPEETIVFRKDSSRNYPTIWVNAHGQRVDSTLPQVSQTAFGSQKAKAWKLKYCRAYHMNGKCPGNCGYLHDILPEEDKLALRRSLRKRVCHVGLSCRDINCYYGHNCACTMASCIFPKEMHAVDEASAELWHPRTY